MREDSKVPQDHPRSMTMELERNRRTKYSHRNYYRIVFEEVATPFDKIDNIKDILLVIKDVLHSKYLKNYFYINIYLWSNFYQLFDVFTRRGGFIETLV